MFIKSFLKTYIRRKEYIKSFFRKQCIHIGTKDSVISISNLKSYFKRRCTNVTDGYVCIIADCVICNDAKKSSKIYINKTTGYFICDKCKFNGSWDILQKFLSIQKPKEQSKELDLLKASCHSEENFEQQWNAKTESCQNVAKMSAAEYNALLKNFSFPNVLQTDISQLNCFYEKATETLYFPLIGLNNSIVGYKMLATESMKEETIPSFGVGGCIKYKNSNSKNENTVVVGMIDDLLALMSKRLTNTIICLPYNLKYLPQQLLPYMESFKKLILWFGNDETSWHTARQFAKKLNEKRCYFIRPIDTQPRPKLAVKIGYDLEGILQNAQPVWHKSIITFQHLREDVLSDLQNIDKVQGVKWKRYPILNRILKGHRRGEFTVLTGPTGCGKTTFMSEYSLDLAMQGINTLWGSFEIRNVRLAKTMLQQMVGVPLHENVENFDTFADAFEKLPIYFMTFHGQQSIKVVMDTVEHATYVHDIAHVVIDNVQFMMGTSDDLKHADRFWKQDDIISRFRNFATKHNCHVTVIIHPRKERNDEELTTSSIFGSAKASQEADNVFIIQDKRLTSIRGKKYLQVAKNRYSGDLGIMVLEFDKSSLSYSSKMKEKSSVKKQSTELDNKQTT